MDTLGQFRRILEERNRQPGAYKLSFDRFQTVFQYLVRNVENYHRPVQLALFTLTPCPQGHRKGRLTPEIIAHFSDILGASLRRSDVYTQCAAEQFLVIFIESNGENEKVILDRIASNWEKSGYGDSALLAVETHVVQL
ncbi:MAG: hypothetical protein IJR72_01530 [Oscillospiraceae bacterium]|nr:hypothetical protein [Oscillospiraceae bacterium]